MRLVSDVKSVFLDVININIDQVIHIGIWTFTGGYHNVTNVTIKMMSFLTELRISLVGMDANAQLIMDISNDMMIIYGILDINVNVLEMIWFLTGPVHLIYVLRITVQTSK